MIISTDTMFNFAIANTSCLLKSQGSFKWELKQESIPVGRIPLLSNRTWPLYYISTGGVGIGKVNKFKQVSSVYHQISVARGSARPGRRGSMSDIHGALYSDIQCIMGNGQMGTITPRPL